MTKTNEFLHEMLSLAPDILDGHQLEENGASCHVPDLEAKLRTQVSKWQSKLLDLGNRNPLINCSFNASRGVVEFAVPDTETIWRKLASEGTAGSNPMRFPWRRDLVPLPPGFSERDVAEADTEPSEKKQKEWNPPLEECRVSKKLGDRDLLVSLGDRALDRRLRTLDGHAHLSLSEQGVHCLYVAFGFLKWYESLDSDVELFSPLTLVPMSLSRSSADAPWELIEAEDDVIDNLCLRERLKQDFGLLLPPLPDIDDLEEEGARLQFLSAVRQAIADNARWEVQDRCALGRFAFPKIAMWQDLGDHADAILSNALCRSIGGDETVPPQHSFGFKSPLPDAATLDDTVDPGEIKTILDCDSSQLEAIIAARRGVSFVLDGPPGTGKSQTIANIIADALSQGRRVLFVSEKVSALEVVKRRLDDCGLGDFCLECHSSKANRKSVLDELKYCLDLPVEVYDDVTPKLEEAKQRRASLNNYVRSIHRRRPLLGLSPYELYGHVSRSHRLGYAAKSRCELPDLEGLDRTRFENWLQLLDRANELTEIIRSYQRHPWRGCELTTRSLTLADELHHHLGVLVNAFGSIDQVLTPLVEQKLLDKVPTPMTLNAVLQSLREAGKAPQVPREWFQNPREIAGAILKRCEALEAADDLRRQLPGFVDDIEDRFSLTLADLPPLVDRMDWESRFYLSVPHTVREQHEFLTEPAQALNTLADAVERVACVFSKVVELLPVPVRADLPPYKLPAVVDLAKLVLSVHPLRSDWLIAENWPKLKAGSQAALTHLDDAARIAKRLEGRLDSEQVLVLNRAAIAQEGWEAAWNVVQPFSAEGHVDQLAEMERELDGLIRSLHDLQAVVQAVMVAWGITEDIPVSLSQARVLQSAIPLSLEMGSLTGQWRDSASRTKLRSGCKAILSDLQEATELREQLDQRLSHRAFKSSAVELVNRAPAYQSIWKRWFGGFGGFRQEAAELFKGGCPPTPVLLKDLLQLRTWHRRMAEVSETADELIAWLPSAFAADQLDAWQALDESLQAFDQFAAKVPEFVGRLPDRTIIPDQAELMALASRLDMSLQQIEPFLTASLGKFIDDRMPLTDLIQRLTSLLTSIVDCQSAHRELSPIYAIAPRSLKTLAEDCRNARRFAELHELAAQQHRMLADLLPPEALPTDSTLWQRIERSLHAIERFSKLVPSLEKYQDSLCQPDRFNSAAMSDAAGELESAHRSLLAAIQAIVPRIQLLANNLSVDELVRRPLTELRSAAQALLPVIEQRRHLLRSIIPALVPDADVPIASLPEVHSIVASLRARRLEKLECETVLLKWNVPLEFDPSDHGHAQAGWLSEQMNAGTISPLLQAVSTSAESREAVTAAIDTCQRVLATEFPASFKFLRSVFSLQAETAYGIPISQMPVGQLSTFLQELGSAIDALDGWLKFARWRRDMEWHGFSGVVEELLANCYPPEETKSVITARIFRLVFDQFADEDRLLGEFDLEDHERSRERFRKLDEWEVKAASTRIRQYQLGRDDRPRSGWFAEPTSELGILQKEIQKKRRQLPLRKLFSEIPSVLQRLKPCVMMSPLSVSTFLQSDEIRFDLVIFDEASQVFPWDAMGAIYRGNQLIVAGDEKQLPPTNFFNRADIETSDDEDDDIGDFESILSLCKSIGMPGRGLRWHYRSRREPLIAFSNRHFYSGGLVTFPSIRDASRDAVRLDYVPQGRWIDRSNLPEAERVTDLIVSHLKTRPETSLGVIAFNQSQQSAIEDAIYDRRRKFPEIEALFHGGFSEPLFVKNLENVQGDERDIIILSMGYGYNEAGKFLKNFGPLTKAGGERRLNVAVTRAREEVILVASVKASEVDLSGSMSLGSHLLKNYLEYAERGVDSLAREIDSITGEAESTFEQEVATALISRGLHPVAQVGCGGFRIDLALKHPERPGEFCLGIECDGATYHSSKTARDRDRIRQNVLENLGWNIVRIWSTDWIRNPNRQLERVLAAFERASVTQASRVSDLEPVADDELEGLVPRIEVSLEATGPVYKAIKDVPETVLRESFQRIVKRGGAIDLEGLIQQTARSLGFARTGKHIRQRLEGSLNDLLQAGDLRWVGERITSGINESRSGSER